MNPDVALFTGDFSKALDLEYRDQAKEACYFLAFEIKCTAQPLTTTNPHKGYLTPNSKPFFSSTDKKLDRIIESVTLCKIIGINQPKITS